MKKKITMCLLALPFALSAQLMKSESSEIKFFSEAPMENIEAVTTKSSGVINTKNNQMALVIPIKSFEFEKALMQEHFNENYLESDKYKNATFKGFIDGKINWKKDGEYETSATGTLNIHGVEQERTIKGKLIVKDGKVSLSSKFNVKLEDHKIKIPQAVFMNIAEVVEVTMSMSLIPKE